MQAIHDGLVFLLDHLPEPMHLVIAGRTDPPLPLPQYRVRRELVEVHAEDLRFTMEEAAAFLNQMMGLNLPARDIETVERMTEGWVAGLQLAALSVQGAADRSNLIRSFSGSQRYVFDYLAQEVLNRQPEAIRSFLVRTSVLERLSAPLCEAVIGETGVKNESGEWRVENNKTDTLSILHLPRVSRTSLSHPRPAAAVVPLPPSYPVF
jgi:LuxR family maltose regulon positive regulatory protein